MYPIGIRVVKVAGIAYKGMTGTVCRPVKGLAPWADLSVCYDAPAIGGSGRSYPAGTVFSCKSQNWRPINPDADDETNVEDKKLEEVL